MGSRAAATVGRTQHLAAFDEALARAARGRGSCVALVGEAGSGKTRLLRDAAARGRAAGMTVMAGGAAATVAPAPFGVLAAALRAGLRDRPPHDLGLGAFAPGLRMILPEWPGDDAASFSAEQSRLLAMEGALRLVAAVGADAGALLLLDDLHDADPETIEFVHHLSASLDAMPIAVVCATRSGEGARAEDEVRALGQRGRAHLLEVPPLDDDEVAALVEAILAAPAPEGFVAELNARADGIPLLIEELIEAYEAGGALWRGDDGLAWTPGARVVPATILEMTRSRIRALPPEVRRTVEALAVLGSGEPELLAHMTGADAGEVLDSLERARAGGLLEATPAGTAFRHALLLEATEASMLPEQRAALHRRAIEGIASRHGSDASWAEELARHHLAVGEHEAAARLMLAAARHALDAHAPSSAEAIARRALAGDTPEDAADGLCDVLAEALSTLGRREEALRLDEERAGPAGAERLMRMAGNALRTGKQDRADELLAQAEAVGAPPGRVRALAALVSLWRGDLPRAVEAAAEALAAGERDGDARVICDALDVYGRGSDMRGERETAIEAFVRWRDVATAAGMPGSRLQATMELGNVEFMTTYRPDSLRETRALARDAGAFPTMVLADLSLIWCLGATGDLAEALEVGDEALDVSRRFELDLLPHVIEAVAWARGRRAHGDGDALLDEAVASAPGDVDILVQAHDAWADWQLRAGRWEDALSNLDRALEIMLANPSAVPLVAPAKRACVLALLGRDQEAAEAMARARAFATAPRLLVVPIWVDAVAAIIARDPAALERAVPPDTPVAYERATLLSLGAQVIGDEHAEAWLRESLRLFEGAGASDDAARTRRLMRERGIAVPRARRTAAALPEQLRARGVTRREAEILALLGDGATNAQIAEQLFLSVRTVESHVSSLLSKLQISSRAGLIAAALAMDPARAP